MNVNIKLLSTFIKYQKKQHDGKIQLKEKATVRDLVKEIGLPQKYVRIVIVNGKQGDLGTVLSKDDTVFIYPPAIGGG